MKDTRIVFMGTPDFAVTILKNLVDNIGGVIFETDPEGNFTFLNNAWELYSGYSIKDSIGKNYRDFLIKENVETNVNVDKLFSRDTKFIKFIFHHSYKGELRWFELKSKALVAKDIVDVLVEKIN